ncbi:hypothetical protein BDW02DRAFT_635139 [Decorospora gaudefroyi]|uniref:Lysine-specific metallo-endopeptidase domain-containing protein n=1 Tax=Decorospora gaudefroyi TaxID=184978 RepID=A0A6A5JVN6_9PLEO|nr:hypothetical protein BDW02DRAFT_635139 [Decorospora gaudefroyi]
MARLYTHLVYLVLSFTHILGYMIDDDCGTDTQFVQSKIDSAFRLLAGAVTELNRTPVDANIDNLFDTLFGRRISEAPDSDVLRRMTRLAAISTLNNNDQTTPNAHPGGNDIIDVRFYCTFKRIKKIGDERYLSKDRNLEYNVEDKVDRFAGCYDVRPPTLAVTMTFDGQFSEVQICPWFLGQSRGFKLSDLSSLSNQPFVAFLSRLAIPAVAKLLYTPIDSFVLTDKVIAHELTHTDQASLSDHFSTIDVGDKPYGFKNAKDMAEKYRSSPTVLNDPMKNADSNALFAVGAWIISQTGVAINRDGTFTNPQTNPKTRRGLKIFEWRAGRVQII